MGEFKNFNQNHTVLLRAADAHGHHGPYLQTALAQRRKLQRANLDEMPALQIGKLVQQRSGNTRGRSPFSRPAIREYLQGARGNHSGEAAQGLLFRE